MEPISRSVTMTRTVPKKPTDMAAFWPEDGRKEVNRQDGLWLRYRDVTIGPFPNRTEASWYDGQIQEIISGWIDKSRFAGRIFPFGDVWYVERWDDNDGPFVSLSQATEYRQFLYKQYREAIERHWDNSDGFPADIERQKQWTKVPVETTDDVWKEPKNAPKGGSGISKPKKTTDDFIDVSFNMAKFLTEERLIIPESLRGTADSGSSAIIFPNPNVEIQAELKADTGRDTGKATDAEDYCSDSKCDCSKFMQAKNANGATDALVTEDMVNLDRAEFGRTRANANGATDEYGMHTEYRSADGRTVKVFNETVGVTDAEKPHRDDSFLQKVMGDLEVKAQVEKDNFGVHIDPATGKPHRNDHICAPICRALAAKAKLERDLTKAEKDMDEAQRRETAAKRALNEAKKDTYRFRRELADARVRLRESQANIK